MAGQARRASAFDLYADWQLATCGCGGFIQQGRKARSRAANVREAHRSKRRSSYASPSAEDSDKIGARLPARASSAHSARGTGNGPASLKAFPGAVAMRCPGSYQAKAMN